MRQFFRFQQGRLALAVFVLIYVAPAQFALTSSSTVSTNATWSFPQMYLFAWAVISLSLTLWSTLRTRFGFAAVFMTATLLIAASLWYDDIPLISDPEAGLFGSLAPEVSGLLHSIAIIVIGGLGLSFTVLAISRYYKDSAKRITGN